VPALDPPTGVELVAPAEPEAGKASPVEIEPGYF